MSMILFDAHVHAREAFTKEFNESVPVYSQYSGAVYMMNFPKPLDLKCPYKAGELIYEYYDAIMKIARKSGNPNHRPFLMPVLAEDMEPEQLSQFIKLMRDADGGFLAGFKLFPKGQSTNSGYAPSTEKAQKQIDVLEDMDVPLALHMEDPDEPNVSKKEQSAIDKILPQLIDKDGKQRNMKISIEHVSTQHAIDEVVRRDLWCTLSSHHLGICQEMFGIHDPAKAEEILRAQYPYFYCKPIIQTRANQWYLHHFWIFSGYKNLMLGTDSAPHLMEKKMSDSPPAGMFLGNAAHAYRDLVLDCDLTMELLEEYSLNAAQFYGVDTATLSKVKIPGGDHLKNVMNIRHVASKMIRGKRRDT
ncbi:MAG: hypothetical protein FWG80_00515 [Alphaproteobacteria bacterium]|nr:hypothetical protein [Alphaproteobacteria bacterium]